jgi:hypothetical protein
MKFFQSKFFSDGDSPSMMRLTMFITVLVILAIWIIINVAAATVSITHNSAFDLVDFKPQMVYVLLAMIFGKVAQSFSENRKAPVSPDGECSGGGGVDVSPAPDHPPVAPVVNSAEPEVSK